MATPITQYCTVAELGVFGINPGALSVIGEDEQLRAIESASRYADDYLASQFTLPLTAISDSIRRAIAVVAVYDLMVVRGFNPELGNDETLRLRYEDAVRWLEKVGAGAVSPQVVDSSTPTSAGTSTASRPFVTSGSPRGWSGRTIIVGTVPGGFVGD